MKLCAEDPLNREYSRYFPARLQGERDMKRNRAFMQVVQKQTGKTAIAMKAKSGCVLVQFDDRNHPHAYGWTLYPRHHFVRRRK